MRDLAAPVVLEEGSMVRNVSIPGVGWGAIVVAVGAMLCSPSVGRAQNLHWVQQFGTPGFDQALATAVDSAGDVYVVGRTRCARGDAYSVGCDAFVHKYDHKGALLWSDVFGSPDEDQATGVAVDDHGYAYVVGHTAGTLPDQSSRSEEHTSELQSRPHLVCRLLLEKKKKIKKNNIHIIKKKNNRTYKT